MDLKTWREHNPFAKRARKLAQLRYNQDKEKFRDYTLKKKYGISNEDYHTLLRNQAFKCAICQNKPGKRRLAVDHCHTTNAVRGLLCHACNVMLGNSKDDPKILINAAKYLIGL